MLVPQAHPCCLKAEIVWQPHQGNLNVKDSPRLAFTALEVLHNPPLPSGQNRRMVGCATDTCSIACFVRLHTMQGPGQVDDDVSRSKDIIATKYIDESLLNAMNSTAVNTINSGDYRQVSGVSDVFTLACYASFRLFF